MKLLLIKFIDIYQITFSPILKLVLGGGCRFTPSCSIYAKESIIRFGVLKGSFLSVKRFVKCNPMSKTFFDPVPLS